MTTITSTSRAVQAPFDDAGFDEAQFAAVSFLARYSGRTLDAYRHDLRGQIVGLSQVGVASHAHDCHGSECDRAGPSR